MECPKKKVLTKKLKIKWDGIQQVLNKRETWGKSNGTANRVNFSDEKKQTYFLFQTNL